MNNTSFNRNSGIGGSDVPVILGLSKWKTPVQLYLEKTGSITEEKRNDNSERILEMGQMLEPYVIKSFEESAKEKVTRRQERVVHPTYNFLYGTIDGMFKNSVFEVKTTSSLVKAWNNGVPPYVKAQVAYYSYLTNSDDALIVVLFRDTGEIRTYTYERDIAQENEIIKYAVDFWDSVTKQVPPMPFDYTDVQLLFKEVKSEKKVVATNEDITIISKMAKLKNEIKERESEFEALKANICIKLGDAAVLEDALGECLVTWKERNTTKLSTDTLKKIYPNVYNECLAKSVTRTFNIRNNVQADVFI